MKVVETFYTQLYEREIEDVHEQNYFFRNITNKLTVEDKIFLDKPITKDELHEALKDLKSDKSPGDDSISKEVFLFLLGGAQPCFY